MNNPSPRRTKPNRPKKRTNVPTVNLSGKNENNRRKGHRHRRRQENSSCFNYVVDCWALSETLKSFIVCYLYSLVEEEEIDQDGEITYEDIVQPQKSTFEKLMSEPKNLEVRTNCNNLALNPCESIELDKFYFIQIFI